MLSKQFDMESLLRKDCWSYSQISEDRFVASKFVPCEDVSKRDLDTLKELNTLLMELVLNGFCFQSVWTAMFGGKCCHDVVCNVEVVIVKSNFSVV